MSVLRDSTGLAPTRASEYYALAPAAAALVTRQGSGPRGTPPDRNRSPSGATVGLRVTDVSVRRYPLVGRTSRTIVGTLAALARRGVLPVPEFRRPEGI